MSQTEKIDSTPEWVVEICRYRYSEAGQIPGPWETITLNRKGALWGSNIMAPRSFKACVNLYRKYFNFGKTTFEVRFRNKTTNEVFPADIIL